MILYIQLETTTYTSYCTYNVFYSVKYKNYNSNLYQFQTHILKNWLINKIYNFDFSYNDKLTNNIIKQTQRFMILNNILYYNIKYK